VLRAYREGRLGADEQEALQEHLVACDWCAELLLGMPGREEKGAAVASLETETEWRKLQPRLKRPARLPAWAGWAAAGVCFLAFLVTLWDDRGLRLERDLPDANSGFGTADPSGATRSPNSVLRVETGSGAKSAVLQLGAANLPDGEYRVQAVDSAGKVLWSVPWSKKGDFMHLVLPLRRAPQGPFMIRVVGSSPEPLAEYPVEVKRP
jgi:hypothetical protein